MSVILTASNNTRGISEGRFTPHYTLDLDSLNTVGKALHLESAQFELHVPTLLEGKNTFVIEELKPNDSTIIQKKTVVTLRPVHYADAAQLVDAINAAIILVKKQKLVTFKFVTGTGRLAVTVAKNTRLHFDAKTSPITVFGLAPDEGGGDKLHLSGPVNDAEFTYALDLSRGKRQVLLYCDAIPPSIEYRDNTDSRILKTFPVLSLNGVNNYIFSSEDKRHLLPVTQLNTITFWLKFNDGEYITSGYPIYLDLRVSNI